MPLGLTNASATFQRAMNSIFAGLSGIDCLVYSDDIVVNGRTLAEHNQRLRNVLEKLEAAGLNLNPKKIRIGTRTKFYFGAHCKLKRAFHRTQGM